MRLRRPAIMCASLIALALTQLPFGARASELSFGPAVNVGPALGEPSIAIGPDDALYVSSPAAVAADRVWKSTDGGASWRQLGVITTEPFGGNDDHVVVAPDNTVYVVGQWIAGSLCHSVAAGAGGAESGWELRPIACLPGIGFVDRPWLAVEPSDAPLGYSLALYFTDGAEDGANTHVVIRSQDGGRTWALAGRPTSRGLFPGSIVADAGRGMLYTATTRLREAVVVSASGDGGATWQEHVVAPLVREGDLGLNHVFLAADDAGTLYTAWADDADGTGMHIWFARSADRARTWSVPARLSSGSGTRVFPALDAGSAGRVVVAWYETGVKGDPNQLANAQWRPVAAGTWNADADAPAWSLAAVTPTPNHHGRLCTRGAGCGAGTRAMLDFFSVAIDAQGRANVTWTHKDLNLPVNTPATDYLVPRQIYFARSS